jgi:hypothetical protein
MNRKQLNEYLEKCILDLNENPDPSDEESSIKEFLCCALIALRENRLHEMSMYIAAVMNPPDWAKEKAGQ